MKEQFECPYCGEHFNTPERYLKPAHTAFVISQFECCSCHKKWVEYGIEHPIYLGYSEPEQIDLNCSEAQKDLMEKYRAEIIGLLNELRMYNETETEDK